MLAPILLITIIIVYVICRRWIRYQTDLFDWHCTNIFPFDQHLTTAEMAYVRGCIGLSWAEVARPLLFVVDPLAYKLSIMTYSHRIKNNIVESGRLAYGSTVRPRAAYHLALPVLRERHLTIPLDPEDDPNIIFGGLGWECERRLFKVYCRFMDPDLLPAAYRQLLKAGKQGGGLVSWTYDDKGGVVETKVYSYGEGQATLRSSEREVVQKDCRKGEAMKEMCTAGQRIVELYKQVGHELDTFAETEDGLTLYFPRLS